ncbi:hypothetical protein Plhal703r1_c06g0036561 [Plasmopara halstedii]
MHISLEFAIAYDNIFCRPSKLEKEIRQGLGSEVYMMTVPLLAVVPANVVMGCFAQVQSASRHIALIISIFFLRIGKCC